MVYISKDKTKKPVLHLTNRRKPAVKKALQMKYRLSRKTASLPLIDMLASVYTE